MTQVQQDRIRAIKKMFEEQAAVSCSALSAGSVFVYVGVDWAKNEEPSEIAKCPVCKRGDIWQEAINRAKYVYDCDELVKGQEVIDYILTEVSVMLEQPNEKDESLRG